MLKTTCRQVAVCLVVLGIVGCATSSSDAMSRDTERQSVYEWIARKKNDKLEKYLETVSGFPLKTVSDRHVYEFAAIHNNADALALIDREFDIKCGVVVDSLKWVLIMPAETDVTSSLKYIMNKKRECTSGMDDETLVFTVFDGGNEKTIDAFDRIRPFNCKSFSSDALSRALLNGVSIRWIERMAECGIRASRESSDMFWRKVISNYPSSSDRQLIEYLRALGSKST